jgi:flagellar motor protein MotB
MARRVSAPGVSFFAFQDIITAVVGIFILITLIMILELIEKVDAASKSPAGDAAAVTRLIDQTRSEADSMETQIAALAQQTNKQSDALAVSTTVTAETLQAQVNQQQGFSEDLQQQLAALTRQVQDAQRRKVEAQKIVDAKVSELEKSEKLLVDEAIEIENQVEKIGDNTAPLYNDTLSDGRFLVMVRLGDHPESSEKITLRDGQSSSTRNFESVENLIEHLKRRNHFKSHYLILVAPSGAADFKELQAYLDLMVPVARYGFDVIGSEDDLKMLFELDLL